MNLKLIKQYHFGPIACDVYQDMDNPDEILVTREQIGQALEYSDPKKAIENMHARDKERFDLFSVTLKLRGTDGKRYDTILYNSKGIYEICRKSKQPKADTFFDFIYEILEGMRLGYLKLKAERASVVWKDTRQLGKQIRKEETDNIKKLVDYATEHGSQNANRYYTSLSILADKAANITDRDKATVDQSTTLRLVERLIAAEINEGIKMEKPYKSIYQACKKRLENYTAIAGLHQLHHEKEGA